MLFDLIIYNRLPRAGIVFALFVASVVFSLTGFAGTEPVPQSQETRFEAKEEPQIDVITARSSRGLITLEGPSGMFINPTSATLPQGAFILNYCVFVPTLPEGFGVVGHGILLSYGVLDWLELGFTGNLLDISKDGPPSREDTIAFGGPVVRIRLLRDRDWWPELSVGTYIKLGSPSNVSDGYNAFVAASKTVPIDEKGFLKTVTFQAGFREAWLEDQAPVSSISRAYGGIEVQLPGRFYAIGEITERDNRVDTHVPWAAGIQWRGRYFGCTIAALQNGGEEGPGFYFGVGGGLGAEPVRTARGGGGPRP